MIRLSKRQIKKSFSPEPQLNEEKQRKLSAIRSKSKTCPVKLHNTGEKSWPIEQLEAMPRVCLLERETEAITSAAYCEAIERGIILMRKIGTKNAKRVVPQFAKQNPIRFRDYDGQRWLSTESLNHPNRMLVAGIIAKDVYDTDTIIFSDLGNTRNDNLIGLGYWKKLTDMLVKRGDIVKIDHEASRAHRRVYHVKAELVALDETKTVHRAEKIHYKKYGDSWYDVRTTFFYNDRPYNQNWSLEHFISDKGSTVKCPFKLHKPDVNEARETKTRLFGVELELDTKQGHRFLLTKDLLEEAIKSHWATKPDGSVSNGCEFVSIPATIDTHRKELQRLFAIKDFMSSTNITIKCGLHIHVSRWSVKEYTILQARAWLAAAVNQQFVDAIAGRKHNQFAVRQLPAVSCGTHRRKLKVRDKKLVSEEKYEAINVMHADSIEFRIFSASKDIDVLMMRLQFCDALLDYLANQSIGIANPVADWRGFAMWIKSSNRQYPELKAWIKDYCKSQAFLHRNPIADQTAECSIINERMLNHLSRHTIAAFAA